MNEEDYEVDENKKPVSFRQRIFPKEEEVGVCAAGGQLEVRLLTGTVGRQPLVVQWQQQLPAAAH